MASCAFTIAAAFVGLVLVVLHAHVLEAELLGLLLEALRARSVVEMPGLTLTTNTLPLPPISSASAFAASASAALVVRGDLRHRHVGLLERRVDEHDLDAGVGQPA